MAKYNLLKTTASIARIRVTFIGGIILALGIIGLGLHLIASADGATSEPMAEKDMSPPYAIPVEPLKPEECGRCHTDVYYLIRAEGGKHRIECRRCHVQFHSYRPGKVEYEEALPKCEACHELVHGEELAGCPECHSEAHAPMSIPVGRALDKGCYLCHPELDKEMKTYITQHTQLYCSSCHHTRHRYVPECMECHQPHTREMTHGECLICHPPHKALQVVYPQDIPQETCVVCHRNAYEILMKSGTKHADLSCTKCHPEKHRAILRCEECHGKAHGDAMLERFRVCGQCHGIAHSLCQG